MKTQMRFQKIICLVMILVGALALLYSFLYCSGGFAELSKTISPSTRTSSWKAADGYYDATLYFEVQSFNDLLMYLSIAIILLGVLLYITSCQKRRNYYVTNYVATGLCAGGNIVISIVLMVMNGFWRSEFLKLDFDAWYASMQKYYDRLEQGILTPEAAKEYIHYNDSTLSFDLGFVVFGIVIIASLLLIFNLVWKILLMNGEKKLLAGNRLAGGETV